MGIKIKYGVKLMKKTDTNYDIMIDIISNIVKNHIDNKSNASNKDENIK
jgi:hypothetical protein